MAFPPQQYRSYGQDELVWTGPLGYPFAQPQPQPQPTTSAYQQYPNERITVQQHVFMTAQQCQPQFFDMIQSSGIQPYSPNPVMHAAHAPFPMTSPHPKASPPHPRQNLASLHPEKPRESLKACSRFLFDGGNFPFRFLGPARRESYCSNMPKVAYCEANRDIKLPGSPVLLADAKDVQELFDQPPALKFPPTGCATWIFRGIHIRLCESFVDVRNGVAELMAFQPEIIGLDCEWFHKKPDTLSLIQISTARHCVLVRVSRLGTVNYPQEFRDLLSNPKIVKVGAGVKDDAEKIEKVLGISVPSTIDLNWLVSCAPMVSTGNFRRGLKKQALSFLHTKMVGEYGQFHDFEDGLGQTNIACTNWEADQLSMLQILYAADDAIFSYMVFMKLYLSFDRRRPCPNFDDSLYTVHPKSKDILSKLRDLVDRPAWMPRHLRDMETNAESPGPVFQRNSSDKESESEMRPKSVQNDLTQKFGNILSAITACAPLDNLAQSALLTLMDVYDSPKRQRTQLV